MSDDDEVVIADLVKTDESTVWHPVLRTCRDEIIVYLQQPDTWGGFHTSKEVLAELAARASEEQIGEVARKMGDSLMQGGDYWESIPFAVEGVLVK